MTTTQLIATLAGGGGRWGHRTPRASWSGATGREIEPTPQCLRVSRSKDDVWGSLSQRPGGRRQRQKSFAGTPEQLLPSS
jgi:hypothetical protein